MTLTVVGAGAFGTALAISYARHGNHVRLVCRTKKQADELQKHRSNPKLSGVSFPNGLDAVSDLPATGPGDPILLAVPTQALSSVLLEFADQFAHKMLVACCKGISLKTLKGPTATIKEIVPTSTAAVLTGPSFAADIARDLPTALALASEVANSELQSKLSTPSLRLYRTTDTVGAELGGALKNVIAIGAGITMGKGLGESARASLMTRGFAEMQRLATALGARPETLTGLSGFGDLALTCTSDLSRNYRYGFDLGSEKQPDTAMTVEGITTARAIPPLAMKHGLELPICSAIAGISSSELTVDEALKLLMSRPLKEEIEQK